MGNVSLSGRHNNIFLDFVTLTLTILYSEMYIINQGHPSHVRLQVLE